MHYLSTNKTRIKKQSVKKWLSSKCCHFVKKYFYGIKLLHTNVQCVYIVYAKYQMASVKALVQVDFPVHVLTLIKKQCKKWLSSKCCHFVKKYFYSIKLLHANVQCVYIVCTKYQDVSVKAVEQVEFPVYALPMQHLELQRAITPTELAPGP